MSSFEYLRKFVNERVIAAAEKEEILGVFQKTNNEFEEEKEDLLQQRVCKEEEVLIDQQLCIQESKSSLDQEDPQLPHIKEEQEDVCTSQVGVFPQQHVCKEEEFLADQQLCNQQRNSSLEKYDSGLPRLKEEQEEFCTSQEGEHLMLKLESDTFMLTPVIEETEQTLDMKFDETVKEPLVNISVITSVVSETNNGSCKHEDSGSKQNKQHNGKRHSNNIHNPTNLKTHYYKDTDKHALKCNTCGKDFKSKSILTGHMRIHTGEKPYVCTKCGKAFKQGSHLLSHMKIHTGEKPYVCKTCGKDFKQTGHLSYHMKIHTGEKPYVCTTCGKEFKQGGHLVYHMKIHTGEKPYVCTTCGKDFKQGGHLKSHMKIHTGEKPHVCETCGKAFRKVSDLLFHTRIHTGEKPFVCSTCGKAFRYKNKLSEHMRIHTDEKNFNCNTCGKAFRLKSKLSEHTKVHTGEKPYVCNTCGGAFHNLSAHMKIHRNKKTYICKTGMLSHLVS